MTFSDSAERLTARLMIARKLMGALVLILTFLGLVWVTLYYVMDVGAFPELDIRGLGILVVQVVGAAILTGFLIGLYGPALFFQFRKQHIIALKRQPYYVLFFGYPISTAAIFLAATSPNVVTFFGYTRFEWIAPIFLLAAMTTPPLIFCAISWRKIGNLHGVREHLQSVYFLSLWSITFGFIANLLISAALQRELGPSLGPIEETLILLCVSAYVAFVNYTSLFIRERLTRYVVALVALALLLIYASSIVLKLPFSLVGAGQFTKTIVLNDPDRLAYIKNTCIANKVGLPNAAHPEYVATPSDFEPKGISVFVVDNVGPRVRIRCYRHVQKRFIQQDIMLDRDKILAWI